MKRDTKIGILAIQGSFKEHADCLIQAGYQTVLIKKPSDLLGIKGLILPGGESTTMSLLIDRFSLRNPILKFAKSGGFVWGTCAGAIMMSKKVLSNGKEDKEVVPLGLMDIVIERNAYGRQLDSFETEVGVNKLRNIDFFKNLNLIKQIGLTKKCPVIFIRAPKIVKIGKKIEVLAEREAWRELKRKNEIVAVKEGNFVATTFHLELGG